MIETKESVNSGKLDTTEKHDESKHDKVLEKIWKISNRLIAQDLIINKLTATDTLRPGKALPNEERTTNLVTESWIEIRKMKTHRTRKKAPAVMVKSNRMLTCLKKLGQNLL